MSPSQSPRRCACTASCSGAPRSRSQHVRGEHGGDGAARTPARTVNPAGSSEVMGNPSRDSPERHLNCCCSAATWPGAFAGDIGALHSPGRCPVPQPTHRGAEPRVSARAAAEQTPPRLHSTRHSPARLHLKEPRVPPPASPPSAADRRTGRRGRGLAALAINIHESAAAGAPLPGPESEKLAEALPRSTRGSGGATAAGAPGSWRGTQRRARTDRLAVTRGAVRSDGRQKRPLPPPQLRPRRCPPARGGRNPAPPGPRDASAFFTAPPGG